MKWSRLIKYFLHGILFSIFFLILELAWAFAFASLYIIGLYIGVIIGIVLLFLFMGLINMGLGVYLWDIDSGGHGLIGLFFHGATLFVILLIVDVIISFLPNQIFPGTATVVATFIIRTFLYGVIGEKVCLLFGQKMGTADSAQINASFILRPSHLNS